MSAEHDDEIGIVGCGIGGLTLALALHARGVVCRIYEAAPELKPLGVGLSILPHGARVLADLGVLADLRRRAVEFRESCFFTAFGQLIYIDRASEGFPQLLVHRGDLHGVLLEAVRERLGDVVVLGHPCTGFDQDDRGVDIHFDGVPSVRARAIVGCDGIHSSVRGQLHEGEPGLVFSGINMWRGLSPSAPFLSGGSHVRAGSLRTGKLVAYPIRNDIDGQGTQLINWVVEIRQGERGPADWSRKGRIEDFLHYYAEWDFDWLDVPALLRRSELVLEYPMVDRDPLGRWTFGRATLLGDAAHPMLPRGANGAMQAILDAEVLAECLASGVDVAAAFAEYERRRRQPANAVVLANRTAPPDVLIETVHERCGDKPFERLEDVISRAELSLLLEQYKRRTGYDAATLQRAATAASGAQERC